MQMPWLSWGPCFGSHHADDVFEFLSFIFSVHFLEGPWIMNPAMGSYTCFPDVRVGVELGIHIPCFRSWSWSGTRSLHKFVTVQLVVEATEECAHMRKVFTLQSQLSNVGFLYAGYCMIWWKTQGAPVNIACPFPQHSIGTVFLGWFDYEGFPKGLLSPLVIMSLFRGIYWTLMLEIKWFTQERIWRITLILRYILYILQPKCEKLDVAYVSVFCLICSEWEAKNLSPVSSSTGVL